MKTTLILILSVATMTLLLSAQVVSSKPNILFIKQEYIECE